MKTRIIKISLLVFFIGTAQFLLFMKGKEPIQFWDPGRAAQEIALGNKKLEDLGSSFEVKSVSEYSGISVASSVAVTDFEEKGGPSTENRHSSSVQSNTLFSADSMTKTLTSATVLRMTEEGKYSQFLPDGVDTKLSDLLPILKRRYPNSTYITEELEQQPNFGEITIAHLAQHTSGLAPVSRQALDEALEENPKLTPDQMIDATKIARTGRFGENIGEYSYNNLGYELLGRVVTAIASEQKQSAVSFGDVVNELVIDRVREKLSLKQASSLQFFTSDQMEDYQGKTRVKARPDLEAIFGKDYKDGSFKPVPSHSYDLASGGSYTDPESMSKIAFHVLASNPDFSIYKTPETLEVLNSRQVPKRNPDGSPDKQGKTYGFGYESFGHPNYSHLRDHGGLGYGSNSNALVDTKSNKAVVVMTAFENLTLPLAYALIHEEKASEPVRLDEKLFEKSKELQARYSEEQLVLMRNSLEKSYEEFRDLYQQMSEVESKESKLPLHEPYNKGLDPTTVEFTSYINGSNDWANIGKEIKYFQNLLDSPHEHERVDAKGYVLTCMFKILGAVSEYEQGKREDDPRQDIDQGVREFLGGDLSLQALKAKTIEYSNEIIRQHGEENTAPALSSVASSYGVRAYMQHLGLATEEEMRPEVEPKKYYQDIALPMPDNMKKNIALAMEKFEESAELGNVRSMGSVVTWAEKCNHPRLHDLNEKWTTIAATAPIPNPNSQIDYAKMLKGRGNLEGAEDMYQRAADFGLIKAHQTLEAFKKEQLDLESKVPESHKEIGQKLVESGVELKETFVEKLGLSEKGKPRSFVEAATAGKYGNIGSKGGFHEL